MERKPMSVIRSELVDKALESLENHYETVLIMASTYEDGIPKMRTACVGNKLTILGHLELLKQDIMKEEPEPKDTDETGCA